MSWAVSAIIVLILGIYMLPWFIALGRNHPHPTSVFLLNLLTGWTLLGWYVALVWAVVGSDRD